MIKWVFVPLLRLKVSPPAVIPQSCCDVHLLRSPWLKYLARAFARANTFYERVDWKCKKIGKKLSGGQPEGSWIYYVLPEMRGTLKNLYVFFIQHLWKQMCQPGNFFIKDSSQHKQKKPSVHSRRKIWLRKK